ncbi:hypothetical protein AAE478_005991 [Parahypoxylon ruwenzoriense]
MPSHKIDAWIEARRKKSQPLTDGEAEAWKQFLLAPPSEVAHHARQIALPIMKTLDDPNNRITQLWSALSEAVDELTDQNDKLADFVLELQRFPDGKGILGSKPWFYDLPLFDNFWTEWIQFQFSESDEPDPDRDVHRQANVNQNAFLAKITAHASGTDAGKTIVALDQRERGAKALIRALERTPWDENSVTFDPEGYKVTGLDGYVPAAAQWITYCAEGMYDISLSGGPRMPWEYPHTGTNWGVQRGWSRERWDFWRKRFLEISTMPELKEGTRLVAKECAERMGEVEKSKS